MAQTQILSAYINLGGDPRNVVYRGPDNPITFPEMLVLRYMHGGDDHVHTLVELGRIDVDPVKHRADLAHRYGEQDVLAIFPGVGTAIHMQLVDDTIPTLEEVEAAKAAANAAQAAVRAKRSAPRKKPADEAPAPAPVADDNGIPDLTD